MLMFMVFIVVTALVFSVASSIMRSDALFVAMLVGGVAAWVAAVLMDRYWKVDSGD